MKAMFLEEMTGPIYLEILNHQKSSNFHCDQKINLCGVHVVKFCAFNVYKKYCHFPFKVAPHSCDVIKVF